MVMLVELQLGSWYVSHLRLPLLPFSIQSPAVNQPDAAQVQSERKSNTEQIPKLKMMNNIT